jgi:metal-responsive CopG/Arc/MetJ family transcriptional regulator
MTSKLELIMAGKTVRTTAALPVELLKAADQAVLEGKAKSRNELLTQALRHELAALERSAIDADFAGMTDDADYHAEAQKIAEQFIKSDWESLHAIQEPS